MVGVGETLIFAIAEALWKPASWIAILGTLQGVGSIVGGVTAAKMIRRYGELRTAGLGLLLFTVGDSMWLILSIPVIFASMAIAGVGIVWAIVAISTAYQRRSPQTLQGRVSAAANMLFSVPQTLSIAAGAALISLVDYRIEVIAMGVGGAASALYLLGRRVREQEVEPALAA